MRKSLARQRRMQAWIAACLGLCLSARAAPARAWGEDGHRVVGAIAEAHLDPSVRAEIAALVPQGAEDTSLATAAVWADAVARKLPRYRFANALHYVNVPPDAARYEGRHCTEKCVVSAIKHYARVLHDPAHGRAERLVALRFVAHFVGDLHQPLHVAHPDDRGGTRTEVLFAGEEANLHWVWDTGLVTAAIEQVGKQAGWTRLAEKLMDAHSQGTSSVAVDPNAWATESLHVSKSHAYVSAEHHFDARYVQGVLPVVEQQLWRAGIRLAALLNAALSEAPLPRTLARPGR